MGWRPALTQSDGRNGNRRERSVWFLETIHFTAAWKDLNLTIDDLLDVQDLIRTDPRLFPVMAGTAGLRKIRFAPRSSQKGKQGSLRVCFAYFPRFAAIVFVLVFAKNQKADLSQAEKKLIKKLLESLEKEFERRIKH